MERFYLTPYGIGYVIPRPNARATKAHLYMNFSAGEGYSVVQPGPVLSWCIAVVGASQSTHDAIVADLDPRFPTRQIRLIPLWDKSGNYLPMTANVRDIVEPYRTNMATYLENHRVPTGWIAGTTTIGTVIKFIIKHLLVGQMLRDNYPNLDLDTEVRNIPAARRQRISAWMSKNGIEIGDITLNWRVRQVIRRIVAQYPYKPITEFGPSKL